MASKFARLSNNELLKDEDWSFLTATIKKDYPNLTIKKAKHIIMEGIKGKFNDFNTPLNFTKVYNWFYQHHRQEHRRKYGSIV